MNKKVVITDYGFPDIGQEESLLRENGYDVVSGQCKTEEEVIQLSQKADAILVQWAPITRKVIESLENCKIIVRYGIGVDNVDLEAAWEKKIPVCNVPDYCLEEVANHTVALALVLARQLMEIDKRVRSGNWNIMPPLPFPPFREMTFATIGYGRIAKKVLERVKTFGFKVATFDLFIRDKDIRAEGVVPLNKEDILKQADIISLHLPLNEDTRHIIDAAALKNMKSSAILINTARGGLIDTIALVKSLQNGTIAGVGLDVFEEEPLSIDHPLMKCNNVILSSHTAWYSAASVPALQYRATKEVIRGLKGEPLLNRLV